jgi:hypothetical protein
MLTGAVVLLQPFARRLPVWGAPVVASAGVILATASAG